MNEDHYALVEEEILKVIDWMILCGAEYDHEGYQTGDFLEKFILRDIQYFMGPAMCEFESEVAHHDFEIAATAVLGSPFSEELLSSMVTELMPVKFEEFKNKSGLVEKCWPLSIEVSNDGVNNNVWVAQRFRLGDTELPDFHQTMTDFVNLAETVRTVCSS
jgi:hypothetical protein